jgi:hypothetical protein
VTVSRQNAAGALPHFWESQPSKSKASPPCGPVSLRPPPIIAHNDVLEVLRVPAVQRSPEALVRIQIHPPGAVLQKGFGVGAALVGIALLVAVCRVRWSRSSSLRLGSRNADFLRFFGAFGSPRSAISFGQGRLSPGTGFRLEISLRKTTRSTKMLSIGNVRRRLCEGPSG